MKRWQFACGFSYFFLQAKIDRLHTELENSKVLAERKVVVIEREMNEAKRSMNAEIEKLRKEVATAKESCDVRFSHFPSHFAI